MNGCPPCPHSDEIDRIRDLLYGNGDEGIRTKLARMEERMERLSDDIKEIHEQWMYRMEVRLRWMVAIATLIGNLLIQLLIKYGGKL